LISASAEKKERRAVLGGGKKIKEPGRRAGEKNRNPILIGKGVVQREM